MNTERAPIAFALDFPSAAQALEVARYVGPAIGMVKVGLELFLSAGPAAVAIGEAVGLPVFLDLKLHDIPETVERAVAQVATMGARLVTVHASGGRSMLKRAVHRAEREGGQLAICAVTVLTSLDDADLRDVGFAQNAAATSLALARVAFDEGVRWFVCSPAEVRALRLALGPEATLVTPGVRPSSSATSDQKRTATPEQAIADGANWVVVGRPIRDAADPLTAARAIGAAIMTSGAL
jgi:orotidine-5'-phosphate decarboxylase